MTRAKTQKNHGPLSARALDDGGTDKIDEILAALGHADDGFEYPIKVYFVEANNAESYLFTATPEQAEGLADYLRDNAGPGTYRVYIRKQGPSVNEILSRLTIRVRTIQSLGLPRAGAIAAPPAAAAPINDGLSRVLESQTRLLEAIAAKLNQPPPDPLAQLALFQKMLETFKAFQPAPAIAPAAPAAVDPLTIFEKGMKFAQDYGGEEREEGMFGLIKSLAPLARDAFEQFRAQGGAARSSSPPLAAIASPRNGAAHDAPQGAGSSPAPDPVLVAIFQKLRDQIQYFATQGIDVAEAADWVWQNVPRAIIENFTREAGAIDALEREFPDLAQHRGYVTALRGVLLEDIRGDADSGGSANAENGAPPGARGSPRNS